MKQIKSPAKLETINFIRIPLESEHEFFVKGSVEDAKSFVHQMRVELSRFRDMIKQQGKVPRHFKMLLVSVTAQPELSGCNVVLKKTTSSHDFSNELEDVFQNLSGGDMIDG